MLYVLMDVKLGFLFIVWLDIIMAKYNNENLFTLHDHWFLSVLSVGMAGQIKVSFRLAGLKEHQTFLLSILFFT